MIYLPLNFKSEDFDVEVNFEIKNIDSFLEKIPTVELVKALSKKNTSFLDSISNSDLIAEASKRLKLIDPDLSFLLIKNYLNTLTSEQLGLLLSHKDDRAHTLVNFDTPELLSELYCRDADIVTRNMEDRQINQMINAVLNQYNLPPETKSSILEFARNDDDLQRDVLENVDPEVLTEAAIATCGCHALLTAIAKQLQYL